MTTPSVAPPPPPQIIFSAGPLSASAADVAITGRPRVQYSRWWPRTTTTPTPYDAPPQITFGPLSESAADVATSSGRPPRHNRRWWSRATTTRGRVITYLLFFALIIVILATLPRIPPTAQQATAIRLHGVAARATAAAALLVDDALKKQAPHTVEYAAHCDAATIRSYATAASACHIGLGRGWALATIPASPAALDTLTSLAAAGNGPMWLAGADAAPVEGQWRWRNGGAYYAVFNKEGTEGGTAAAAAGSAASSARACSAKDPCRCASAGRQAQPSPSAPAMRPGQDCSWEEEKQQKSVEEDAAEHLVLLPAKSIHRWIDLPAAARAVIACAVCERSLCIIALDCNATNTLAVNASKYFVYGEPCWCVCRDGFSGARCDDTAPSVSVNGAYVSQFMGECASQPLSWADAAGRCSGRGNGWALATINSASVQATVAALTPSLATWIGGSDAAAKNVFAWQFGRLKGQSFFSGRKTGRLCAAGPCSSPEGMYSNFLFNALQPTSLNNTSTNNEKDRGGQSFVSMLPQSKMWTDGPPIDGATRCYVCERSP